MALTPESLHMLVTSNPQVVAIERDAWPRIAKEFHEYSYEQSLDYADAMAAKAGATARFLAVQEAGRVLGVAAVRMKPLPFINRSIAYISGGPMTHRRNVSAAGQELHIVLKAIRRQLVEREGHILYLRLPIVLSSSGQIELDIKSLRFESTRRVRSYRTITVDLAPDEEDLLARLAGKWRTDLKYAQRAGLILERGTDPHFLNRFMKLFGEMREAKNFDVHVDPRTFFALSPESIGIDVLIATKDGKDAAGHVLSRLGDTAVYLFGATNDLGRATKAGYLLNWQSMLLAKAHGHSWYDLGGIDPESNPGVYTFKSRMGGRLVTALGPYEALPGGVVGATFDGLLRLREMFSVNKNT
jgi:lipid II:glycine glycyltransferase (peptidoglycan interpeptide bridge formation enzyme)